MFVRGCIAGSSACIVLFLENLLVLMDIISTIEYSSSSSIEVVVVGGRRGGVAIV